MATKGRIARIQDPVHGLMEFKGMETVVLQLLRTPELQRLRKIRQTGLAFLVFPGAEHSRFVHSLGTAYLAIRFAKHLRDESADFLVDQLRPNDASVRDLAVAALCHDLGHGPLSHAWEREVIGGDNYNLDLWIRELGLEHSKREEYKHLKWHELVTQSFLAWEDGMLHKILEIDDTGLSKRLRSLLLGKYFPPYLPSLISSDIDVDRADFLRRDSHQTGVTYGWFDLERLISTSKIGKTNSGSLVVGFDEKKSLRVIEQFLIARRALYENVYYHKTVRAAEGMVGLFFKRLKEVCQNSQTEIQLPKSELYESLQTIISGGAIGPQKLLALDDFSLWVFIESIARAKNIEPVLQDLAQRIVSRDLFKEVPCDPRKAHDFILEHGRDKLYGVINKFRPEYYLIADTSNFSLFSNKESQSVYTVDGRVATPIKGRYNFQDSLISHFGTRIFTIPEAVESISKIIG